MITKSQLIKKMYDKSSESEIKEMREQISAALTVVDLMIMDVNEYLESNLLKRNRYLRILNGADKHDPLYYALQEPERIMEKLTSKKFKAEQELIDESRVLEKIIKDYKIQVNSLSSSVNRILDMLSKKYRNKKKKQIINPTIKTFYDSLRELKKVYEDIDSPFEIKKDRLNKVEELYKDLLNSEMITDDKSNEKLKNSVSDTIESYKEFNLSDLILSVELIVKGESEKLSNSPKKAIKEWNLTKDELQKDYDDAEKRSEDLRSEMEDFIEDFSAKEKKLKELFKDKRILIKRDDILSNILIKIGKNKKEYIEFVELLISLENIDEQINSYEVSKKEKDDEYFGLLKEKERIERLCVKQGLTTPEENFGYQSETVYVYQNGKNASAYTLEGIKEIKNANENELNSEIENNEPIIFVGKRRR